MKRKLSHSQIQRYLQCPRSYDLYYNKRLREKSATAFLALGSAIDESLNTILLDYKKNKKVTVNYKDVFDKNWETIKINNEVYPLFDCTLVGYAKADFVPEVLTDEDIQFINAKIIELTPSYQNQNLSELKEFLDKRRENRKQEPFFEEEHKVLNIINYLSLRRKAHLMLDAYVRDIIPEIEEVRDIQLKIELESDTEESLIGYVDTVVKFKGENEYTVLDNKTSASPYSPDKVLHSEQLSIYTFALGLKRAAYAVMWKTLKLNVEKTCKNCGYVTDSSHKTCNNEIDGLDKKGNIKKVRCNGEWQEKYLPEAKTQLLVDYVTEKVQNIVIENISDVSMAINAKIFYKNHEKCSNFYGNVCPFIKLCWTGKDDSLITLPERE